ncbi:MAG: hypothetical protein IKP37_09315 [Paludibacteraceae bacterium]|nr:hypothetical protein [Paludibacteraceae bacterium]
MEINNCVFEDNPCYRFHFDQDKSLLKITLDGYYDTELQKDVGKECTLVIKKWSKAKGKQLGDERLDDIECHLGIVDIIRWLSLSQKNNCSVLEMEVITYDNRFVYWYFENPIVELIVEF